LKTDFFLSLEYVRNLGDAQCECHQEAGQENAIGGPEEGTLLLRFRCGDRLLLLLRAIAQQGRSFSGRHFHQQQQEKRVTIGQMGNKNLQLNQPLKGRQTSPVPERKGTLEREREEEIREIEIDRDTIAKFRVH
jgi:hypothetical protein